MMVIFCARAILRYASACVIRKETLLLCSGIHLESRPMPEQGDERENGLLLKRIDCSCK